LVWCLFCFLDALFESEEELDLLEEEDELLFDDEDDEELLEAEEEFDELPFDFLLFLLFFLECDLDFDKRDRYFNRFSFLFLDYFYLEENGFVFIYIDTISFVGVEW